MKTRSLFDWHKAPESTKEGKSKMKTNTKFMLALTSLTLVALLLSLGLAALPMAGTVEAYGSPATIEISQPMQLTGNNPYPIHHTATAAVTLNWSTCSACPEPPEVSISDSTITLGIADRPEYVEQNRSIHGASAPLPSAAKYTISFDFTLFTWDSYNPTTAGWTGYWDSFSVSVSDHPYWELPLSDPVTPSNLPGLGFIWGGTQWADGILERVSGSKTVTVQGNPSGTNYLNVVLDTATEPESNHLYPSWGTITIKNVSPSTDLQTIASQAANLARTVVGGKYLWGGKGWNWKYPKEYVSAQKILTDGYWYYKAATKSIEFDKGLDCSGLVYWSFDKTSGSTTYYGNPIYYEGAHQQCGDMQSDAVNESDLRPGDLLCFNYGSMPGLNIDHVAMYVGGSDPNQDVVQASYGIGYASKNYLKSIPAFRYFRRVKQPQVPFSVQTHSPISLVVTDPDGFTISSNTLISTGFEYIAGIPGVLYYAQDGNLDDVVYAPTLKAGTYTIQVVPKPGASSTDTFSLEVTGAAKLVVLAQNVPVSDIPPLGYRVISTGDEIVPGKTYLVATATGTGTASFSSSGGVIESLTAVDEATLPPEGKPDLVFPHGFFSFNITGLTAGQTVTVTIALPSPLPVGTQYWKYHASEGGWIQIPMGSDDGDDVITITLVDGGLGDDDGVPDGVIVDDGGPGQPTAPPPIPVGGIIVPVNKLELLAPWLGLAALASLAALTVAVVGRRRG